MPNNHYDVVIIGTGAGGGTLASKLAPTGKKILLLERGDYVPREKDNWSSAVVNLQGEVQHQGSVEGSRRQGPSSRTPTTTSAATRSSTARRCSVCARRTSARFAIMAASHQPGRSPTTIWNLTTTRPRINTTCTASAARIRPSRLRAAPIRIRRSAMSRACSNLSDDFARHGLKPFHTPLGIMLDEKTPHKSTCIRCNTCDGFPCLVHAKSDAQVLGVDPALTYPNVSLMTNAYVERLETSPSGREVTKILVKRNGSLRGDLRRCGGGLRRRHQLRRAAAAVGE